MDEITWSQVRTSPEYEEALSRGARLSWDGPPVGESYPVGDPTTLHDEWWVIIEVPDPDDPGRWSSLEDLLCDTFEVDEWVDATIEAFTGAEADPTTPGPYRAAEDRLLARIGIDRGRLSPTVTAW